MGKESDSDKPNDLRELACRVRVVASTLDDAEKERLRAVAAELEDHADRMEGESKR